MALLRSNSIGWPEGASSNDADLSRYIRRFLSAEEGRLPKPSARFTIVDIMMTIDSTALVELLRLQEIVRHARFARLLLISYDICEYYWLLARFLLLKAHDERRPHSG